MDIHECGYFDEECDIFVMHYSCSDLCRILNNDFIQPLNSFRICFIKLYTRLTRRITNLHLLCFLFFSVPFYCFFMRFSISSTMAKFSEESKCFDYFVGDCLCYNGLPIELLLCYSCSNR